LDEAVKAGVIHPHVRRAEIEDLRKPRNQDHTDDLPAVVEEIPPGGHFEVKLPKDMGADQCAQIKRVFHGLKKFGVEILPVKALEPAKAVVTPAIGSGPTRSLVNQQSVAKTQPVARVGSNFAIKR
jgi:hypothetical protein